MALRLLKKSKNEPAGTDVWFNRNPEELPKKKLASFKSNIFASYSGPDCGLSLVHQMETAKEEAECTDNDSPDSCRKNPPRLTSLPAGCSKWSIKNRKAYGISMSLYDQHPVNGRISGDPIADSFALCARENSAVLIVADGVNWGEKSRLAARCAVYGAMRNINQRLFSSENSKNISTTDEVFKLLLSSLDVAHETILRHDGGLTTLCIALVCPLKDSKQFVVCVVNVGDSLAFVLSRQHGAREITTGSHDVRSERNIRDAGGALGPVNGQQPELHNLTCSMTLIDPGDIVYLATDGITDNFDPVVTKIAVAKKPKQATLPTSESTENKPNILRSPDEEEEEEEDDGGALEDGKPVMLPHERHQYAIKEMERIIHEFELFTESPCSAQELCGALLQHVLKLTDPKRKVLENPKLYGKKMKAKDREQRDTEIVSKLSKSAGKLDHATVIGYEVGCYHGNEDEDYGDCGEELEEAEVGGFNLLEPSLKFSR